MGRACHAHHRALASAAGGAMKRGPQKSPLDADEGARAVHAQRIRAIQTEVAPQFQLESFSVFAEPELSAAPLHVQGVCFNPACQRRFVPVVPHQAYCCAACSNMAKAELRKWSHAMAVPLLAWRFGKYEQQDAAIQDRTRAARRFISQAQSTWLAYRQALAERAEHEQCASARAS